MLGYRQIWQHKTNLRRNLRPHYSVVLPTSHKIQVAATVKMATDKTDCKGFPAKAMWATFSFSMCSCNC